LIFASLLSAIAFGCSSNDDGGTNNTTPQPDASPESSTEQDSAIGADTSVQPDSSLPLCPEEVKLSGSEFIPCDCYGHEANETTLADPNVDGIHSGSPACITQVVCCPSIQNLRCEDHEYVDDAGNIIDPDADTDAGTDAAPPTCPFEIDLSTTTLPCVCKGTVVPDPPSDLLPECEKKIVCCPSQGVICE
jgi:hypothetical protein